MEPLPNILIQHFQKHTDGIIKRLKLDQCHVMEAKSLLIEKLYSRLLWVNVLRYQFLHHPSVNVSSIFL